MQLESSMDQRHLLRASMIEIITRLHRKEMDGWVNSEDIVDVTQELEQQAEWTVLANEAHLNQKY